MVGTGVEVADQLEAIVKDGAADGFVVSPAYLPDSLESFVDAVVPELQRRGVFRKDYAGETLRDHLGIARPKRT
jgi:alkanesulfonate monooxygenase SsuD/methylene tetrahydromethanopterin reductase-like flavin-dependent oxidoreductase (luciferase family)